MEFNYGHLIDVGPTGNLTQYRFQNYAVGQSVGGHSFLPFAFGGAVASLSATTLMQRCSSPTQGSRVTLLLKL